MNSRLLGLALPVSLLVPLAGGCMADHTVGTDKSSSSQLEGDSGAMCVAPDAPCAEPNIPPGCSLGEPSCVDGVYLCPPVVCPDAGRPDAASCSPPPAPCPEPMIPPGCSLGAASCSGGAYLCPPIVCPDAGSCAAPPVPCAEPNIPPGCSLGPSSCVDGQFLCPAVVCADGG